MDDASKKPTPVTTAAPARAATVTANICGMRHRRIRYSISGVKHWVKNIASTNGTSTGCKK